MGLNRITLAAVSKRLKVEKDGRETSLDVIEIVLAGEDGGLSQAEKQWEMLRRRFISGYVLEVEQQDLLDDWGCERVSRLALRFFTWELDKWNCRLFEMREEAGLWGGKRRRREGRKQSQLNFDI